MKKSLSVLFSLGTALMLQAGPTYGPYPTPGGTSAASFATPIAFTSINFPTNFTLANPCLTNQVIIWHTNGTSVTYSNTANTDAGRGATLQAAFEDASGRAGDIIFLSAGRFVTSTANIVNAQGTFDLTYGGTTHDGAHMVGMGKTNTIVVCDLDSAYFGQNSCMRDLTITNFQAFSDYSSAMTSVASNQFVVFQNVEASQPTNYIDIFFIQNNRMNFWLENCTFRYTYDVFASAATPFTNSVIVSHNCSYYGDAQGTAPILRTQYGVMAKTAYVYGDYVTNANATLQNIGVDGSDSGLTNSILYVWNTTSVVSGAGQKSISAGRFASSKLFIGDGNSFDVVKQNFGQPYLVIATNWIDGKFYTNDYGYPITVIGSVVWNPAAVAGTVNESLYIRALPANGGTTNVTAMQTLVTTLAMSVTNSPTIGFIPTNAIFCWTNLSTGAGNSARVQGGQIKFP